MNNEQFIEYIAGMQKSLTDLQNEIDIQEVSVKQLLAHAKTSSAGLEEKKEKAQHIANAIANLQVIVEDEKMKAIAASDPFGGID
jgi:predicted double-glycine peptidase